MLFLQLSNRFSYRIRQIKAYDFTQYSENLQKLNQNNYQFTAMDKPDPYVGTEEEIQEIEDELKQMSEWREEQRSNRRSTRRTS